MWNWMEWFDRRLTVYLEKNLVRVPKRWKKVIASFYPDANIRKYYLQDMGVVFDEHSFANIGFIKVPNTQTVNKVYIGKNVSIAPNVVCICEANANNGIKINAYPYVANQATCKGDIHIEDEVWLGANVIILPGITIGKCSIVGAGSVVTKSLPPYGVYVGVPAKRIKDIRGMRKDEGR